MLWAMKKPSDHPEFDFSCEAPGGLDGWRAEMKAAAARRSPAAVALELCFAGDGPDALADWRREQAVRLHQRALREGLPLGEVVRVVLQSDLVLQGRLLLHWTDEAAGAVEGLHFEVQGVSFSRQELVSCVRVDGEPAGE